jgi:hypothetical protein
MPALFTDVSGSTSLLKYIVVCSHSRIVPVFYVQFYMRTIAYIIQNFINKYETNIPVVLFHYLSVKLMLNFVERDCIEPTSVFEIDSDYQWKVSMNNLQNRLIIMHIN